MFVYGPPGNGKTVISQAIQKLLKRGYVGHLLQQVPPSCGRLALARHASQSV